MKLKLLAVTALLLITPLAAAESKGYFGAQYSMTSYDEVGFPSVDPTMLIFRGGSRISKNFSVEGRFGIGLGDASLTIQGTPVTVSIDSVFGVYALGHVPVSEAFSVYGAVGMSSGELTVSIPGTSISVSQSDTGLSYGFGADFAVSKTMKLNVEYMTYLDETDYDFTALAVGVTGSF